MPTNDNNVIKDFYITYFVFCDEFIQKDKYIYVKPKGHKATLEFAIENGYIRHSMT